PGAIHKEKARDKLDDPSATCRGARCSSLNDESSFYVVFQPTSIKEKKCAARSFTTAASSNISVERPPIHKRGTYTARATASNITRTAPQRRLGRSSAGDSSTAASFIPMGASNQSQRETTRKMGSITAPPTP